MSIEQDLPHAQLVQDWATGKPLPADVQTIKDWLEQTFSNPDTNIPNVAQEIAKKAHAERWHPDSLEAALLICQLAAINDQSDKPVA